MERINTNGIQTAINDGNSKDSKVIRYESIPKRTKKEMVFNLFGANQNDVYKLGEAIKDCLEVVKDKDAIEPFTDIIKESFEISCYILYDRQIMNEVIYKQKSFGVDYVADFLRYILRVFVRRYNEAPILTKNQCNDIKSFCKCFLQINNSADKYMNTIERVSAKEIVEVLKNIVI